MDGKAAVSTARLYAVDGVIQTSLVPEVGTYAAVVRETHNAWLCSRALENRLTIPVCGRVASESNK